jgi:PKD repeat protein
MLATAGAATAPAPAAAQRSTPVTIENDDTLPVPVRKSLQVVARTSPRKGVEGQSFAFSAMAVGGNPPLTFTWDFGDASLPAVDPVVSHQYDDPGDFQAVVVVTDVDGDQAIDVVDVTVAPDTAPSVTFSADPASGVEPLTVTFSAHFDPGNEPSRLKWTIDGIPAGSAPTLTHEFAAAGDYAVTCEVMDADYDYDTDTLNVMVEADGTPATSVQALPSNGLAPLQVQFTCLAPGGNQPFEYHWEFGNGATSSLQNPVFTYTAPGSFLATCTATDADGDVDLETTAITAFGP